MDTKNKGAFISVIICTYNHSRPLTRTLDALLNQEYPGGGLEYEVIVVDNNSNDDTKETVMSYAPRFNGRLKYCFEPSQGQAFARNAGIKAAKADIVVFTDDDCVPAGNWFSSICDEFRNDNSVMILTGQTGLLNKDHFPLSTKVDDKRQEFASPCAPWEIGHGNNLSIKKSLFNEVGTFNVAFGPGTFLGCADDTDFIYRALKRRHKIVYSPRVFVYHAHSRVKEPDVDKIVYNYAKGRGAFYMKNIILLDINVVKLFLEEIKGLLRKYVFAEKNRDRQTQRRVRIKLKGLVAGSAYAFSRTLLYPSTIMGYR